MTREFFIDTSPSGKAQFVTIKRSRSHNHQHHHHHHRRHSHHSDDYVKVNRQVWDTLVGRERALEESYQTLHAENTSLKANLGQAQGEISRLGQAVIPQLQDQIAALTAENRALRRSVDVSGTSPNKHVYEIERLQKKNDKLEAESRNLKDDNSDLRSRIRSLTKQVDQSLNRRVSELARDIEYWRDWCRHWKGKYEDSLVALERRDEKIAAYEDILRRHHII